MISPKQKKILAFPYSDYDAIICDGAVRSGKTSIMTVGFIDWAMREFSNQRFGICGKTVGSATKNIIVPYISMAYAKKRYTLRWRRADKVLEVSRGAVKNYFEVFGGKDESSFMLIQGRTLAGVLLDEVALMPRSFVEQALARCSVDGALLWFNCNPENPGHWFYKDWIQRHRERNALYLRFTMEDNPSLSEKTLQRYKAMYSGVFYRRYVLGEWCAAEGLIYTMFKEAFHVVPSTPRPYDRYYISVDYGTINPTSAGLWGRYGGKWYRVREYYFDSRTAGMQRTDEEHYAELEKLVGNLHPSQIRSIIVDPSAASFIEVIRRHDRFRVEKASNAVIDGIRNVAARLQCGDIFFCDCCTDCIREFELYRWDERRVDKDQPIKQDDHSMDDTRYFVQKVYAPKLFSF